jgi:hypothetical protein
MGCRYYRIGEVIENGIRLGVEFASKERNG